MKTKVLKRIVFMAAVCIGLLALTGCPPGVKNSSGSSSISIEQKKFTVDGISFAMNKIAEVTAGSTNNLGHNRGDDFPYYIKPHRASISAYMIGETEVTQELWQAVMGYYNNPSHFDGGAGKEAAVGEAQSKRPVEMVSWYQAIAFCNKLSLKLGLEPCYKVRVSGSEIDFETLAYSAIPTGNNADWNRAVLDLNKNGFRLPTEAEWEWAAKGGTENKWAGTDAESSLGNYAWYGVNSGDKTHQVAWKNPNGYGLYDMSGNVWEWCHDWQMSISEDQDLGKDYTGPQYGVGLRIFRGGSCRSNNTAEHCLRSYRNSHYPYSVHDSLGLRLVCRP